jgi:hypothetical protein
MAGKSTFRQGHAAMLAVLSSLALVLQQTHARAVDYHTLKGQLVVGFQGWFMCPGDGRPGGTWYHWFDKNIPDAAHLHFDLVPDTSEFPADEVCPTAIPLRDGSTLKLFSDQRYSTVLRQFTWMNGAGIGPVALQRFVSGLDPASPAPGRAAWDKVLDNVRRSSKETGVGYYLMYDIAGAQPDKGADLLLSDWTDLLSKNIVKDPTYQHEKGAPVLAIAGIGSSDRPGTAKETADLVVRLRQVSAAYGGVTLIASCATNWRTLDGDAKTDPQWAAVYRMFDIISPWTVGRYGDEASYLAFVQKRLLPDVAEARRLKIGYMPVIYPGASTHNLHLAQREPAPAANSIPRNGGKFLWLQAHTAYRLGLDTQYAAMFDEVDEGTALFKVAPDQSHAVRDGTSIALDADGVSLPADWYLRVAGIIGRMLNGRIKPERALPMK